MSTSLHKCHSIADLRSLAQRRIPKVMFDYIDGGSEDEVTLARNNSGFGRWQFLPRALVDATRIDLSTRVQGCDIALPLIFSPTGGTRLFHHRGEFATSAAAAAAGTVFALSSMASIPIETVAAHTPGDKWFQIYVWKDRGVVREFIQRCKAGGYKALCLTVDVATPGQRERDLRNGFTLPPRFTMASLIDIALHPRWWWHTLTTPRITLANVVGKAGIGVTDAVTLGQYVNSQLDASITWKDMEWMISEWGGPFLVKGILAVEDARIAIDCGATGVILSNHGGRQLDHSAAPIDVLPEVVDAVGDRTEVLVDGGVRRGTDVVKALALGAKACMIGRPYLYGLAAGGEAGVHRAIGLLRDEIKRDLMLLGCPDVKQLHRGYLRELRN
ncbi:MAG: alpha-hydroxy acid oxidase [Gammaproteobacteria bacterium]